ncbi:Asp23/Gls24 family envelope stress response protein [Crassaminicella profunda]|uniref:Asp23/Gls24 family envelope stress response protein n=1 Tax=Crassaminicella profunda TaxID=1286698 RepID=UPI001CA6A2A0|nr:Asp23/Gls24 family envelope stress response protein [Crassaminicella profunda]QZY57113.1 Asp23/Gls24 family envelope stress response protein [Crassaminicella profunda]
MGATLSNKLGNIFIDHEVLASIAGVAAMECYGLVGMAKKSKASGIVELLKRENQNKGVKVSSENDEIIIDLFVVVGFGTRISTVAQNIIDKVKYNIETITGLKVKQVNINIQGVRVEK